MDKTIFDKLQNQDYRFYFTNRSGPPRVSKIEFKDDVYYVHIWCNRFGHGASYLTLKFDNTGKRIR